MTNKKNGGAQSPPEREYAGRVRNSTGPSDYRPPRDATNGHPHTNLFRQKPRENSTTLPMAPHPNTSQGGLPRGSKPSIPPPLQPENQLETNPPQFMGSGKTSILSHQAATLSATTQSILRPAGSSNSLVHPADNIDFKRPAQALPHPDAPLAPNLSSSAPSCSAQTPETRRGGYGLHSPESGPLINANVSLNEEEDDPCIKLFPGFYNIDADGDVEVHVLSEPGFVTHRFRVSKAILGFHSTVFSGLVNFIQSVNAFPNSETASMSQTLQKLEPIPLHVEDDPTGLYAVLLILHHQYRQLPKVPTLNTMVEIAKVCEKYMVQWAVLPTATLWRTRIDEDTLRSSSPWLYLAWTFGWEREFEWITNDIIPRLEPPKEKGDGLLRTDDGRRLESYLPEVLVERLLTKGQEIIANIRTEFLKIVDQRAPQYSVSKKRIPICKGKGSAKCDWLNLGFLCDVGERYGLLENAFWTTEGSARYVHEELTGICEMGIDLGCLCWDGEIVALKSDTMLPDRVVRACSWPVNLKFWVEANELKWSGLRLAEFQCRRGLYG